MTSKPPIADQIREFVLEGFSPRYGEMESRFESNPLWARLRELGSELWLDTGSLKDAAALWTRDMSALTTNNTLLNKEVQTGRYDELVRKAAELLARHDLSEHEQRLELAFILNAYHALRLVETFDAHVSVEEHTDLAHDVDAAVKYARRYHAVCPERFIVKIPLTPAGVLATRRLSAEGVPVNHTLGFSARQNYLIARVGRPAYVNVFLGRLNAFVADNGLGDGAWVGERATLASQAAIRQLRERRGLPSRQIGASLRDGRQVRDLAGLDVLTMPPKVASGFLELDLDPDELDDRTSEQYQPSFTPEADPEAVRVNTLWDIDESLVTALDALENENLDMFSPDDLLALLSEHGVGDLLVPWTQEQRRTSFAEGKIPRLENWREPLADGAVGLDSLMNLAGLNSFIADQKEMDDRVEQETEETG